MCGISSKCCGGTLCRPDYWFMDYMNVCEPIVRLDCPFGYVINTTSLICTRYNRDRLCKVNEIRAEYPKSMENHMSKLMCRSLTYK